MRILRRSLSLSLPPIALSAGLSLAETAASLSEDTETCLTCHISLNPGIVSDWRKSRHARVTPAEALKKAQEAGWEH